MVNQNVNRRCKRTSTASKLKSRGTMKNKICKRASVRKSAVSSKFIKKMAAGLHIKKGRVMVRRRTAKKSRSASRKAGSKRLKSRKSICVRRKSMKPQKKKRVSSKKRNVIRIQLRKCSKSRSRSSIRRVQKKRVSSKRRTVIRKHAKARKSSKSRSSSSIKRVHNKRVSSKRRTVNRKTSRRAPKRATHSKKRNNKKCVIRAIKKRRSTVVKRKNSKPGSKCDKKLRLAIEEFLNCTQITEKELSSKELQKTLLKLKKRNRNTSRKPMIVNRSKSRKSVKRHTKISRSNKINKLKSRSNSTASNSRKQSRSKSRGRRRSLRLQNKKKICKKTVKSKSRSTSRSKSRSKSRSVSSSRTKKNRCKSTNKSKSRSRSRSTSSSSNKSNKSKKTMKIRKISDGCQKKHKHGFEKVKGIGSLFVERLGKLNITSMNDLKKYAKCTTKRKFISWLNKELCSNKKQVQNLVAEMCFIEPVKKQKTVTTDKNIAATTPSKTGMLAGILGLTSTAKPSTTDASVAPQVAE